MDFNRSLTSFRPHLDASKNIIQLALDSTSPSRAQVIFSSSIAVVGRYPITTSSNAPIPEASLVDPAAIDHFGYAEAKWVCEQMFQTAGEKFAQKMVSSSVRIGQMTGPEGTGAWNVAEHFPMIVKSCKSLGVLPVVDGVRRSLYISSSRRRPSILMNDGFVIFDFCSTRRGYPSIAPLR